MSKDDSLRDLIERVEKAEGPDRELDALIAPLQGLRVVDEGHPIGRMCYDDIGSAQLLPRYTCSIDAAMLLRPEGWTIAQLGEGDDGSWFCELREGHRTSYSRVAMSPIKSPTPALALVAASLRAHMGTGG